MMYTAFILGLRCGSVLSSSHPLMGMNVVDAYRTANDQDNLGEVSILTTIFPTVDFLTPSPEVTHN